MKPRCVLPDTLLKLVTGAERQESSLRGEREEARPGGARAGCGRGAIGGGSIEETEGKALGAHLGWLQGQRATLKGGG